MLIWWDGERRRERRRNEFKCWVVSVLVGERQEDRERVSEIRQKNRRVTQYSISPQ